MADTIQRQMREDKNDWYKLGERERDCVKVENEVPVRCERRHAMRV